jgi:hypothetical protein
MTVLHTIGDYKILSEKDDKCPPNWCWQWISFFILLMIVSICILIGDNVITGKLWIEMGDVSIVSLILIFVPFFFYGCGVMIIYQVPDRTKEVQYTTTYKFSNNSKKDAERIQIIINNYVIMANNRILEIKSNEEIARSKSQQCCVKYKEVMEGIK